MLKTLFYHFIICSKLKSPIVKYMWSQIYVIKLHTSIIVNLFKYEKVYLCDKRVR